MARKKKKVEEKEIIYAPIDEQPITLRHRNRMVISILRVP